MLTRKLCWSIFSFVAVFTLSVSALGAVSSELAQVNGKKITSQDFDRALSGFSPVQKTSILGDINSKRQILNNMVEQELLFQEGEKLKIDQTKEFKESMDTYRKQLVAQQLLKKNVGGDLTESAMKKYFDANKSRYSTDQARAQHILLESETKANEIKKLAMSPNADFQDLAVKHSKDPTAKKTKGDLGQFGRDIYVKEFTEAVFNAQAGEIVGPVKTPFGYHVIKVLEKKIGTPYKYEEVQMKVRGDLQQELILNYLGKLKKTAKITLNDQGLEKINP